MGRTCNYDPVSRAVTQGSCRLLYMQSSDFFASSSTIKRKWRRFFPANHRCTSTKCREQRSNCATLHTHTALCITQPHATYLGAHVQVGSRALGCVFKFFYTTLVLISVFFIFLVDRLVIISWNHRLCIYCIIPHANPIKAWQTIQYIYIYVQDVARQVPIVPPSEWLTLVHNAHSQTHRSV